MADKKGTRAKINNPGMNNLSYDDFSRWRVPELKEYLRDRGLKTTGRKVELVALAYGANQMGVDTKKSCVEEKMKNKQDYLELLSINEETIPDPLFLKGWVSEQTGITQWPPTMYFDIAEYLSSASPSDFGDLKKRLMTDYKEGKAYSYFDSKFLKEVKYHPISKESKYCILSAYCTPSQKINSTFHTAWVCCNKTTGCIHRAYCTCFAG